LNFRRNVLCAGANDVACEIAGIISKSLLIFKDDNFFCPFFDVVKQNCIAGSESL